MNIKIVTLVVSGAALALGLATTAVAQPPAGDIQQGKQTFLMYGCYSCHGTAGNGANTGPKLAPGPIPLPAFMYQLRHPRARMPRYGTSVLSDTQARNIYAYLASIPPGPSASQIPMLND